MVVERPGIVDLRDLAHRYMWEARAIARFVVSAQLKVAAEPAWRGFAPPRVVVVIVPVEEPGLLPRSRPWLAEAGHLVIVRDATAGGATRADRELVEDQWRAVLATLPPAELHDWLDAGDGAVPRAAVSRAVELGLGSAVGRGSRGGSGSSLDRRSGSASTCRAGRGSLDHGSGSERMPPDAPSQRTVHENPDLELPASAWVAWITEWRFRVSSLVAAQLANRDGRAVLVDGGGTAIDLAAPGVLIGIEDNEAAVCRLPLAGATAADRRWLLPGLRSCGVDPVHPIGWRGHRMAVYWSYVGAREIGFLSATDHDWPCGPAKKLWGYADNDPVAIAVTPRGDLCAQTFEHDVLVTVGMPIGWHRAGEVDVAAFARDPRRAVFYAQTAEFIEERGVDNLLEEDNRELAPVVVLGPDETTRYAVDLRHRVVRVTYADDAAAATVVGGPDAGFAVFDAEHRLVRRGVGLLLGGWFRHATIEHDGALWREDLATGARMLLGAAVRVACLDPDVEMVVQDAIREGRHEAAAQLRASHPTHAIEGALRVVAIPGTRNVIEIGERHLRVL